MKPVPDEIQIYIDGGYYPKKDARISVFDHGFLYMAMAYLKEFEPMMAASFDLMNILRGFTNQQNRLISKFLLPPKK